MIKIIMGRGTLDTYSPVYPSLYIGSGGGNSSCRIPIVGVGAAAAARLGAGVGDEIWCTE
jgi:hypothetical protein